MQKFSKTHNSKFLFMAYLFREMELEIRDQMYPECVWIRDNFCNQSRKREGAKKPEFEVKILNFAVEKKMVIVFNWFKLMKELVFNIISSEFGKSKMIQNYRRPEKFSVS